jgi:uncharacterized membrane protein
MRIGLLLTQVVLALVGLADASYLTWEKINGFTPSCTAVFKCDVVLNSSWAHLGPIPVSALGMVFYLSFLILIISRYLSSDDQKGGKWDVYLHSLSSLWSIIGVVVSLILITVMAFILKAWCLFCLVSATSSILLAVTTFVLHRLSPEGGKQDES